jgi:hypothetical protein
MKPAAPPTPPPTDPDELTEHLAVANFSKFAFKQAGANRDVQNVGQLSASLPYLRADIEALEPQLILLAKTLPPTIQAAFLQATGSRLIFFMPQASGIALCLTGRLRATLEEEEGQPDPRACEAGSWDQRHEHQGRTAWRYLLRSRYVRACTRTEESVAVVVSNGDFAPGAQSVGNGRYYFLKFVLELDHAEDELIVRDQQGRPVVKEWCGLAYGVFAHELTHYCQAISTVLGQRILLGLFATVITVAKKLHNQNELQVPVQGDARGNSKEATACWNTFIREHDMLLSGSQPLRPPDEVKRRAPWEFYEYSYHYPTENGVTKDAKAIALVVPVGRMEVGVPLLGDVFIEGQAWAVERLVDQGKSLKARLDDLNAGHSDNSITATRIYYTTVIRLVLATLPKWNPVFATILLCDVALSSGSPGETFVWAYRRLRSRPPHQAPHEFVVLRREFAESPWLQKEQAAIKTRVEELSAQVAHATPDSASGQMDVILSLMLRGIEAREHDASFFMDLRYRRGWWQRMVWAVGAPPIFFKDDDCFTNLNPIPAPVRACFWTMGTFDLLSAMIWRGFTRECPYYQSPICDSPKTDACQRGDLLNAPVTNGKGCHMAFAAIGMELYGRRWRRSP